jgi:hypothetical protein
MAGKARLVIEADPGDDYLGGDGPKESVPIQSFLHMIGIGEDPESDAAKAKAAKGPVAPPRKYERERRLLDRRNVQPVAAGTLLFTGAAVISGKPYRLVVVLTDRAALEVQGNVVLRLDTRTAIAVPAELQVDAAEAAGVGTGSRSGPSAEVFPPSARGADDGIEDHKVLINDASRKYYQKADDRKRARKTGMPLHVFIWPLAAAVHASTSIPEGDPQFNVVANVNPCSSLPSNPPSTADVRSCFLFSVLPRLAVIGKSHAVHKPPYTKPGRALLLTPSVVSPATSPDAPDAAVNVGAAESPGKALSRSHRRVLVACSA